MRRKSGLVRVVVEVVGVEVHRPAVAVGEVAGEVEAPRLPLQEGAEAEVEVRPLWLVVVVVC